MSPLPASAPPAAPDRVAAQLTDAARALARRLDAGATLWCVAPGWASHARHVAVEFLHPVVVGARAFPAVALADAEPLEVLASPADAVVVVAHPSCAAVPAPVAAAARAGVEVFWLGSQPAGGPYAHVVALPSAQPLEAAEHAVRAYHVLWELTQLWLEHQDSAGHTGPLGAAAGAPPPGEPTGFLYPFLEPGAGDPGALAADLARSARDKWTASEALRRHSLDQMANQVTAAATDIARRVAAGGRIVTFGNGGSAADAQAVAERWTAPPWGRPLPARCLVDDPAVLTALANDIGVEVIFARQVAVHVRPVDVALGLTTSGGSPNVLAGFAQARRAGSVTVGVAGYGGGALAAPGAVDHCLAVASDSVHRIQEAQVSVVNLLWRSVQGALGERSP